MATGSKICFITASERRSRPEATDRPIITDYHTEMASKVYYFGKWPCCFGDLYSGRADYHNLIYFRNESDLFVNLSPSVHAPLLARGTN
jgi:hypothetical protein